MPSYAGDRIEQSRTNHQQCPSSIHGVSENVDERHALSETLFLVDGCFHVRKLDVYVFVGFCLRFEGLERLPRLVFLVLEQ